MVRMKGGLSAYVEKWSCWTSLEHQNFLVIVSSFSVPRAANNFLTWKDICPTKTPSWSDKTKLWSDRFVFIVAIKWFTIKKLSGHHVRPHMGFSRQWANCGWPMSDDRLLFAALSSTIQSLRLVSVKYCYFIWFWMLDFSFILSFLQRRTKMSVYCCIFLGHWNQCQQKRNQKNDLGKHKQLTLKTAFSNAKDASRC